MKYTLILTLVYFVVSFIGLLHHEIWFDEAQAWLIARDSISLADLFHNLRYEGHPFLWHFLLFGITRFTADPFWMQFLHTLLATTTVFVFLKNAPFNWIFKILFIFGYYMLFEYNAIARSYILGVLLLFLACSLYKQRQQKFLLLALLLALASNVHLFFGVVAACFFLILIYENSFENKLLTTPNYAIGIAVFALGFFALICQVITPDDNSFFASKSQIPLTERIMQSSSFLLKGLVNIIDFRTLHFWNTNLLVNSSKPIVLLISVFLGLLPLLLFYKRRKLLFFVYGSFLGMFLVFFIARVAGARFNGIAFLVVIMALWMGYPNSNRFSKFSTVFVYCILLIHLFSGIYAYTMDFKYPFFSSNPLVNYIKDNHLDKKEIAAISYEGVTLSAMLQRKVFFLSRNQLQSFYSSKYDYKLGQSEKDVIASLRNYSGKHPDFIFVSYLRLNSFRANPPGLKIRYLNSFGNTIFEGEASDVFVYEISANE